jgi:hypothetical protein
MLNIMIQPSTLRLLMRIDTGDIIFTAAMLVCVWFLCRKLERLIKAVENINREK